MREINKIIVHCSDSPHGRGDDVEDIRRWHLEKGWSDIGYHYVINEFGDTSAGRDLNRIGAHCAGYNSGSIGICLIGVNEFTQLQFVALEALLKGLMTQFDLTEKDIYGHYDFSSYKSCPNFNVQEFMSKI